MERDFPSIDRSSTDTDFPQMPDMKDMKRMALIGVVANITFFVGQILLVFGLIYMLLIATGHAASPLFI